MAWIASFSVGVLVGVLYALLGVRAPVPPLVALLGLLGMLGGETAVTALRPTSPPAHTIEREKGTQPHAARAATDHVDWPTARRHVG